jgi:hypothetical protein
MKKIVNLSIIKMAICLSTFAASAATDFSINEKPWENFSQDLKVMNVCNLSEEDSQEIMQGERPEVAVEFSKGTLLPISFFFKGNLLNLVEGEAKVGQIEIQQTFYVRHVQGELIMSANLTDWKPFLEFITGNASITLNTQNGQPSMIFGAETNRRL